MAREKALTRQQRAAIDKANRRLQAALNTDIGYYAPAVQKALQALEGNTRFTKSTLRAAQSFNRSRTSTTQGIRAWAAENGYNRPADTRQTPTYTTAERRRIINTANARLKAMRARGEEVPERYKNITTFKVDTANLAGEFLQNPSTTRTHRKGAYKQLPAKMATKLRGYATAIRNMQAADAYYLARENGDIPEDMTFAEFSRSYTPPEVTGADVINYVERNGSDTTRRQFDRYRSVIRGYGRL